jgi:Family of unknown function (DUF6084)
MPDLNFVIEGAEPVANAAAPQLAFQLKITDAEPPTLIQSILLRVQIRIEPTRRRYQPEHEPGLRDLFGSADTWGRTMRSMLWTNVNLFVPSFTGTTLVELPVPCTFDFNVAATKYFHTLHDGDIPLSLLFSGTVFFQSDQGLQATPISWEREARCGLAARVWHDMMQQYYPDCAWLCLRRDSFERLNDYRSRMALPTWEQALDRLLLDMEKVPVGNAAAGEPMA